MIRNGPGRYTQGSWVSKLAKRGPEVCSTAVFHPFHLPERFSRGVLTPCCPSTRPGTPDTGATPARTRRAARPCRSADARWRWSPAASKPLARARGDPAQPLLGAPPRDDHEPGRRRLSPPSRFAPSSCALLAWTRGSAYRQRWPRRAAGGRYDRTACPAPRELPDSLDRLRAQRVLRCLGRGCVPPDWDAH